MGGKWHVCYVVSYFNLTVLGRRRGGGGGGGAEGWIQVGQTTLQELLRSNTMPAFDLLLAFDLPL